MSFSTGPHAKYTHWKRAFSFSLSSSFSVFALLTRPYSPYPSSLRQFLNDHSPSFLTPSVHFFFRPLLSLDSPLFSPAFLSQQPPSNLTETVFYLSDMHTVEQGDKLTGELTCAPNGKNPRDLDIVIDYKVQSKTGGGEKREYRMA